MAWRRWKPYVPVATRRLRSKKKMDALRGKGVDIQPVTIEGRKIARTFWGEAWCEHIEAFHDYSNRLPRGRAYVRNGSVCHLAIKPGTIEAKVMGSRLYELRIGVKKLPEKRWSQIKKRCAGQVGSLLELLQGRLSDSVMEVVTHRSSGLFPLAGEITFNCGCPDWAVMCKHVAAALYGVGARLDEAPSLLFLLRGVDQDELIAADAETAVAAETTRGRSRRVVADDLSDVFGIELDLDAPSARKPVERTAKTQKPTETGGKALRKTAKKSVKKGGKKGGKTAAKKTRKRGGTRSEGSPRKKPAKRSRRKA